MTSMMMMMVPMTVHGNHSTHHHQHQQKQTPHSSHHDERQNDPLDDPTLMRHPHHPTRAAHEKIDGQNRHPNDPSTVNWSGNQNEKEVGNEMIPDAPNPEYDPYHYHHEQHPLHTPLMSHGTTKQKTTTMMLMPMMLTSVLRQMGTGQTYLRKTQTSCDPSVMEMTDTHPNVVGMALPTEHRPMSYTSSSVEAVMTDQQHYSRDPHLDPGLHLHLHLHRCQHQHHQPVHHVDDPSYLPYETHPVHPRIADGPSEKNHQQHPLQHLLIAHTDCETHRQKNADVQTMDPIQHRPHYSCCCYSCCGSDSSGPGFQYHQHQYYCHCHHHYHVGICCLHYVPDTHHRCSAENTVHQYSHSNVKSMHSMGQPVDVHTVLHHQTMTETG